MEPSPFVVRAGAGTLRPADGVVFEHAWTVDGVVAGPVANGAQALHLSVALCVLNDTFREGQRMGLDIRGVVVTADGQFDDEWHSTGIEYAVTIDSPASEEEVAVLIALVDDVAEIPKAIRRGAAVEKRV
jgi:hypothetical protein